jgi:hypothetical protein
MYECYGHGQRRRRRIVGNLQWACCPSGSELPSATRHDCLEDLKDRTIALSGSRWTLVRFPEPAKRVCTYSFSFQNAKATFCRPCESQTPAIPSSPQRKARERAMSCVKSAGWSATFNGTNQGYLRLHASPSSLQEGVSRFQQNVWRGHVRIVLANCQWISLDHCQYGGEL